LGIRGKAAEFTVGKLPCYQCGGAVQSDEEGVGVQEGEWGEEEVNDIVMKAGATRPCKRHCTAIVNANLGVVSTVAAADAGPFTVHFWAPMSKWLISGASFMELDRPTEKISLAQYSALTLTGFFFSRYALLVTPINYTLW
jgi:hypothetical protein